MLGTRAENGVSVMSCKLGKVLKVTSVFCCGHNLKAFEVSILNMLANRAMRVLQEGKDIRNTVQKDLAFNMRFYTHCLCAYNHSVSVTWL